MFGLQRRTQNAELAKQKTNGDKMMMRQLKFILMIPALVGILLIPAFSQEDMEVVDNEGFSKKQRPPAVSDMMNTTRRLK